MTEDRNQLLRMIREAATGQEQARAVAALDVFDRQTARRIDAGRELDFGARIAAQRLTPVPIHEHHTAATDWLADESFGEPVLDYRTAMISEASSWYAGLDREVRADAGELAEQASGRARTIASAYANRDRAAAEFMRVVGYLRSTDAASGLPQIDQTVDPNNAPSPTPYPTEVFPTFGEEQDPFNQVETNNHQSGASSMGAPLIQQVEQMNNSGSGYGTGPEKPDSHTTAFDPSGGYAEVPLGPPGQIPTAPAATDSQAGSAPTPLMGQPQDAGADQRQVVTAVAGYSMPDPYGYRWAMSPEVTHPFHERCGSAHWPDETCEDRSHTASLAVGYLMDIEGARRQAQCEAVGVREGLRAIAASAGLPDLGKAHNRFTAAWGDSDRTADDSAVLHGFMAVVRPVLADLGHEASIACTACKGGDCSRCDGRDCGCAKHGMRTSAASGRPHGKVEAYVNDMAREYKAASIGGK